MPYKFKGKRDCKQSDGTKGTYLTVKKDGSKRCYQGEKQYKASQAWSHEADEALVEDDAVKEFRQYVRRILSDESPTPSPLKENKIYNTFSAGVPMRMQSRADPEFARLIKQRPVEDQYVNVQVVDENSIRQQIRKYVMEDLGAMLSGLGEFGAVAGALGIGGGEGSGEKTSVMDDANAVLSDLFPSAGEAEVDIEEIPEEEDTEQAVQSSIGAHLMAKVKAKGAIGLEGGGVDDGAVADAVDELKSEIDDMAASLKA